MSVQICCGKYTVPTCYYLVLDMDKLELVSPPKENILFWTEELAEKFTKEEASKALRQFVIFEAKTLIQSEVTMVVKVTDVSAVTLQIGTPLT